MKKAIKKLKSKYDISMKQEKDIKEMFLKVRDENQLMFIESSSYNIIFELDKNFAEEQFVILDQIDIKSTIAGVSSGSYVSQDDIAKSYILGLQNDLKEKIEKLGYEPNYIQFYITPDYSTIAKIEVKMKMGTQYDSEKIINLILENFNIDKENILIT